METPSPRELLEQAGSYLPPQECELVRRAFLFAASAHGNQPRKSGEPYITHPLAVAKFLAEMHMSAAVLAAALLHDVAEDTSVQLDQIENQFSPEIRRLVDGLTELRDASFTREMRKEASLEKMLAATSSDIRVLLIKLSDRLHNMRTLQYMDEDRRKQIAKETLAFYAPLAERLGIWQIKSELETLALKALNPEIYHQIIGEINSLVQDQNQEFLDLARLLESRLMSIQVKGKVVKLPYHPYSIYRTKLKQGRPLAEIREALSICVLVEKEYECYTAIAAIHGLWTPIPGKFDDYIVMPKENFYRSLHTGVMGPGGKPLRVRVRTYEMHEQAEYGVFALWRYHERGKEASQPEERQDWLKHLAESSEETSTPREFIETLMADFLQDRIFVFTPAGEIMEFPMGATPLDLAYYIHTDIGHACRGARVNGQLVPLNYKLRNGDRVEVVTVPVKEPKYEWLNPFLGYRVTSRSGSAIRRWFRRQPYDVRLSAGKVILEKELARIGKQHFPMEQLTTLFYKNNEDALLTAIGGAQIGAAEIAVEILNAEKEGGYRSEEVDFQKGIYLHGSRGLEEHMAACCNPEPGEAIVGEVKQLGEVIVHRADCPVVLNLPDDERVINLSWEEGGVGTYPMQIEIRLIDGDGILNEIAKVVSAEKVNMSEVHSTSDRVTNIALVKLTLEVHRCEEFVAILHRIGMIKNVIDAKRVD